MFIGTSRMQLVLTTVPKTFRFKFRKKFHFFFQISSSKSSSGNVECSYYNRAQKISPKFRKKYPSKPDNEFKIIISAKSFNQKNSFWHVECSFENLAVEKLFLVFVWKKLGFFGKNWIFFQNRSSWQFCCRIFINWFYFLKMSSLH